jgi:hypothetical protein
MSGLKQQARVMDAVQRDMAPFKAVSFKAWRLPEEAAPRFEAHPANTDGAATLPDAMASALANQCFYAKETLFIEETDYSARAERRHVLHTYRIRKRSRVEYWRNPVTGKTEPKPALYPEWQFSVAVPGGFQPAEPWKMSDGDAVGVDRNLIEVQA